MDRKDVVYLHSGGLLNHKIQSEIMPFAATQMDLKITIPNEVSQKEKDTISLICGI